eukprot:206943_1
MCQDLDVMDVKMYLNNMDTIVGPQNTNIPVLGRYTHARSLVPKLRELSDLYGNEDGQFINRDNNNAVGLINRLISQMDMAYDYIINNAWILTKELFINTDGYLDGEGISSGAIGDVKGISLFPKDIRLLFW